LFFYDFCPYLGLNQDQLLKGQHAVFDWGCGSNGEESNGEEEEKTVILTSFPLRLENGNVSSLRRMSISWVVEKGRAGGQRREIRGLLDETANQRLVAGF
jgi:hypothetical protein